MFYLLLGLKNKKIHSNEKNIDQRVVKNANDPKPNRIFYISPLGFIPKYRDVDKERVHESLNVSAIRTVYRKRVTKRSVKY
ncbi:MAG: hypothetical protein WAM14_25560 [Candidatus Nitrosopolaris sp.]